MKNNRPSNKRTHRIYAYLNEKEMDTFLEAMRIRDLAYQGNALRTFAMSQAEQIVIDSRKFKQHKTSPQAVTYHFPSGGFTVFNPTKH